MTRFSDALERLSATIEARKGADPASSYTAQLLSQGLSAPPRSSVKRRSRW